jgi:hypothetical protein
MFIITWLADTVIDTTTINQKQYHEKNYISWYRGACFRSEGVH